MRLRGQEGYTLPELLVVMAIFPLVVIALWSALDTTNKLAPRTVNHSHAVEDAGNGLSRAIREIRQSYRVLGTTPNSITFVTATAGVQRTIHINCSTPSTDPEAGGTLRRCVRTSAAVGGTLPDPDTGTVLVDRIINGTAEAPVFEFTPNPIHPTFVRMLVQVPARGEGKAGTRTTPITLDDGTLLRNSTLGS
jgi:prepilin-type N-terminal cleavage/methylation domain-containing protein